MIEVTPLACSLCTTGSVAGSVYGEYCRCMGVVIVILVLLGLTIGQVAFVGSEYWLVTWSVQDPATQQEWKWVWGYSIFIAVIIVMAFTRSLLFYGSTLRAATRINARMVRHCLCTHSAARFHTLFVVCVGATHLQTQLQHTTPAASAGASCAACAPCVFPHQPDWARAQSL